MWSMLLEPKSEECLGNTKTKVGVIFSGMHAGIKLKDVLCF